jgi:flagellar FliJ protein
MNPPRSTRLEPLQQVADQREQDAMRQMADCHRRVEEHQQRLLELQRYLQDYSSQTAGVSTPALISNRQSFLAKLREAETMQMQLLQQAQAQCDVERARWMLKHRDVGVLQQLAAAYRVQEKRQVQRIEQKNQDEITAQRMLRADQFQQVLHVTR